MTRLGRPIPSDQGKNQRANPTLKPFQAKWTPVRVKKTRQIKNLESRFDSIETEKALATQTCTIATALTAANRKY
jgi:hypothetical protein